jgi:DNA invertase Pin-like site-specific DNA recombinase
MFVGYGRPSIRDQSPSDQLDALHLAGCGPILVETAVGARRDRPMLKGALQMLQSGDTLVVWKLDRLARSIRQLVETIADLQRRHVALKVLSQQLDTDAVDGKLIFHVFATVGEFERELTLEQSCAGLATAKALGRRGGRKPAMGPVEIKRAKALLMNPCVTVEEVARLIGVRDKVKCGVWEVRSDQAASGC